MKIKDIIVKDRTRKDYGDIESLKNSIKKQGLLQPIGITKDNELVFGERRLIAVKELKWQEVECKVVDVTSIVEGECDENYIRKDFVLSEKVEILKKIKEELGDRRGKPNNLNSVPGHCLKGRTTKIAGDMLGVGESELERAKKVVESENTHLVDMMDKKVISTKDCANIVKEDKDTRVKIIKLIDDGEVKNYGMAIKTIREEKKIEEYRQSSNVKPILHNKDYKEYLKTVKDKSVDLLITDPPFFTEEGIDKDFVSEWLSLSLPKIKDDGRAYIFIGAYPKEIFSYLSILLENKRFIVDNPLIWTYRNTLGVTPKMKYNLNYQMCLHLYSKDSKELDTGITNEMFSVQDINAPDGRLGDRFYKWQKPDELSERLIRHSTKKGDTILDPFAGSGSFLLAASRIDRKAIGCEKNIEVCEIAKERGCDYV